MSLVLNGVNQYLRRAIVRGGTPKTYACWFKANEIVNSNPLIAEDDGSAANISLLSAAGNVAGDPVSARCYKNGWATALSTAGYSVSTWHHACAVFGGHSNRRAYLDGGSKGTDTTDKRPVSELYTWIGSYKDATTCFGGKIAEAAIWGTELSDAEILRLAQRTKPSSIQPIQILAYWSLLNDALDDSKENRNLIEYNSPSYDTEDHPETINSRIITTRHIYNHLLLN